LEHRSTQRFQYFGSPIHVTQCISSVSVRCANCKTQPFLQKFAAIVAIVRVRGGKV